MKNTHQTINAPSNYGRKTFRPYIPILVNRYKYPVSPYLLSSL